MEKRNVNDVIKQMEDSSNDLCGSIYTKEQVLSILKSLSFEKPTEAPSNVLELLESIKEKVEDIQTDMDNLEVDKGSAEFSINYSNEVCIDSCDIEGKEDVETKLNELFDLVDKEIEKLESESE